MSDNIKVAIKVRPLIDREKDAELPVQWTTTNNKITQIDPETQRKGETYTFDYIFDDTRTNLDVFNATVKPVVEAAMLGFNGTIFAYGQTSSGKTYTMMGTRSEPGVIPLAVEAIFDYIKNDQMREFVLSVSYLEIYNEKVNDLLDTERRDLKVREENGEIKVEGKEEVTHSVEDILHVMRRGDKNRRIGETNMNERSSRSHTIFKITIGSVLRTDSDGDAIVAQLNLVDLAGSERARQTGATGERFNEGRHINLSLSTLGLVIKQLSEDSEKSKVKHISYRDSKLTRILQPSLGGNSLTTIICAVTPAAGDETLCTLAFAQRAKGIKNKPKVNETASDKALVKRFRKHVQKLEESLEAMSAQLEAKNAELEDMEVLKGRIELLKTKILSGVKGPESKKSQNRRRTWAGSGSGSGGSFEMPLPTIQEAEGHPEQDDKEASKEYIRRRQSVFQKVQLATCDEISSSDPWTQYEDFELQLVKDEQDKMSRWSNESNYQEGLSNTEKNRINMRRVKFEDENEQSRNSTSLDACMTPEKKEITMKNSSPGTPKADLRMALKNIRSEYDELRQFTTLEKQIFKDSSSSAESTLAFMQKSLFDTEQICKDLSKKHSELQSEHVILKNDYEKAMSDCQILRKQVENLTINCEKLGSIENERDIFKNKFNETMKKLKILEDETSSHAYAMELTIKKHKTRELELEASLNSAWEELNYYKNDNKHLENGDDKKMEIIIDELKKQIELSNFERQKIEENQEKIVAEYLEKIHNYEKLILDNNEFKEKQEKIVSEFLEKIDNYEREINIKNLKLMENSGIHDKLKIMEEKIEFLNSEKTEITKNYENIISEYLIKIENYEKEIIEKNHKLSESLEVYENLKIMKEKLELSNVKLIQLSEDNEKMISEFSFKLKDYENELIIKNSKIIDFEKEILEKTEIISNFEKTIAELSSKISESQIPVENSENELKLKEKIENLTEDLQKKNDEINELKLSLEETKTTLTKLDSEKCELLLKIPEKPQKLNLSSKTLDETSIFTNASYFDSSCMDISTNSLITSLSASVIDPEKSILDERQLHDLADKSREELLSTIATIEAEYKKLLNDYKLKISSTEEIQSYICGIKIDMENLQKTILSLTNENAELTSKLSQQRELASINSTEFTKKFEILQNENTDLSVNLMEKIERIEVLEKENIELSSNLMEKIEEYDETIYRLKSSSKDSDNCKKCAHLSELIRARHALKNDVKSVDKKLHELHEDFQRKSADIEKLQEKAKEDLNISSILNDTIFNGSICESPETLDPVAYVDEKVQKLHGELDGLKTNYEKLTILYEEKCSQIEELKEDGKLSRIKEQIQKHHADVQKVKQYVDSVMKSLDKFKSEKLKSDEQFNELKTAKESIEKNFTEERELLLKRIENLEFNSEKEELTKKIEYLTLENMEIKENYEKKISELSSNLENKEKENEVILEINEACDYIKKEIISLKPDIIIASEMNSIIELFKLFITTIMSKEKEIITSLQLTFKNDKLKLEEENKQLADAEKRSSLWTKELESEIERLQSVLSASESLNSGLTTEISSLKNHLKELEHEKKLLNEKVQVMEADYVTLQNDLESSPKSKKTEEIDKIMQEAILSLNLENSAKIEKLESSHRSKIEELENSIECLKTKNFELRNTIDGLTAKEESMKSIIDLKTIDCEKSAIIVNKLEEKLQQLTDNYEQSLDENRKSSERIEELTRLLKIKCDKLSEYKTTLEGIRPEFELLKEESLENGKRLEKYKSEIEYLRESNGALALSLKEAEDALKKEITKSSSCLKQLQEVTTKNTHLQEECERIQAKLEESMTEIERLNRKVRNSTSRLTVERDIEDLKDEINGLKKSLDGASNRIVELQVSKKELSEENDKLNREIEELKTKNKELDEEMDEIVERMKDMDIENGRLETKIYEYERKNKNNDYEVMKSDYEDLMVKYELLAKENVELKGRDSERPKSAASSRSTSPVPSVAVRRKRRSDLFNQNRQELAKELVVAEEMNCNCENFREKIGQLEHELVLKKGKIKALEMKIGGMCDPYKKRCEDYEERLGVYKRTFAEMKEEIKRMKARENAGECERCKKWKERKRDAGIQCIPEAHVLGFSAPKSGIIEEQRIIDKLERDKAKLKELCSNRCYEIKDLTRKIRELERKLADGSSQLPHSSANDETKENVPINILGQSKSLSPSNYYRINQS